MFTFKSDWKVRIPPERAKVLLGNRERLIMGKNLES